MIHAYIHESNTDAGIVKHRIIRDGDVEGDILTTGETIPLLGRQTPAMRRVLDGNGEPCEWYVGTDAKGNIVRTN